MEVLARIVRLHDVLKGRTSPIQASELQDTLGCSRATLQRMLARLRDELQAPLISVPEQGYQYDPAAEPYDLPGLWLGADELAGLMVVDTLLARLEAGVLQTQSRLLRAQIDLLLGQAVVDETVDAGRVRARLHIVAPVFAAQRPDVFAVVCEATLHGRRLTFCDYARKRAEPPVRQVSPRRLRYFNENWFLEAWCHDTDTVQVFALARLHHVQVAPGAAHAGDTDTPASTRLPVAAPSRHIARLRFVPAAAASVAGEFWHPAQHGQFATDGSYELSVPYAHVGDVLNAILRHGPAVVVEGPKSLRKTVTRTLARTMARYDVS